MLLLYFISIDYDRAIFYFYWILKTTNKEKERGPYLTKIMTTDDNDMKRVFNTLGGAEKKGIKLHLQPNSDI